MAIAKTLAYFDMATIKAAKSFKVHGRDCQKKVIKREEAAQTCTWSRFL
jgi:hypothetical protein